MLTSPGTAWQQCDRVNRRAALMIGGLAAGGLTLPQLLRAEKRSGLGHSHKQSS